MFRGVLKVGKTVRAVFLPDATNSGSAHLLLALGRFSGGSATDSDTAAPGGRATVTVKLDDEGLLELLLDVASEEDGGSLEVSIDGTPRPAQPVRGDTRWTYSVEK
jgi:hypothetical protein